jgi:hypothetical protein
VLLETSWPAWKEKLPESGDATISLKELGQVIHTDNLHLINFAAAVSRGGAVVELRDGTQLVIRIANKGIEVNEIEGVKVGDAQLSFAFNDRRSG